MRSKLYFFFLSIIAIVVSYNCHGYKGLLVNSSITRDQTFTDSSLTYFDFQDDTVLPPVAGFSDKRPCKVSISIREKALDNDFNLAPPPVAFNIPVIFSHIEKSRYTSYISRTLSTNLHAKTSRGPPSSFSI